MVASSVCGKPWGGNAEPVLARTYRCTCGRPIFFRNSICLGCNSPLGYEPYLGKIYPLTPAGESLWKIPDTRQIYRRCANLDSPSACNWLLQDNQETGAAYCISCRLNRMIPDLTSQENAEYWRRVEVAKRRLVSSLIALRLPVDSRVDEDPQRGLAFDFLRPDRATPVQTGHENGIITLNIEEADDATRERLREQMHEPYRTLLGHLRHESGHYYWDRLIVGSKWHGDFKKLFGDENQDYSAALQKHYQQGAPSDWPQHFVTAYASSHPWEDWAETWAHYLHLVDTLDTALSFGLQVDSVEMPFEEFTAECLWHSRAADHSGFLQLVNSWVRFTALLNELSRSMGLPDFYPFVFSRDAVAKLHFVHSVIRSDRTA